MWLGILVPQPPKPLGNKGFLHFQDLARRERKRAKTVENGPLPGKSFGKLSARCSPCVRDSPPSKSRKKITRRGAATTPRSKTDRSSLNG